MRTSFLAILLVGCASSASTQPAPATVATDVVAGTQMQTSSFDDSTDVANAAKGPLRGTLKSIDKTRGTPEAPETFVTVSLENTGATECTVSEYKLDMQLGAVASAKAPCSVGKVKLSPGSKSDTQCRVNGATKVGDAPGLAVGNTPVVDIVATCK